jgi:hypothetical protein
MFKTLLLIFFSLIYCFFLNLIFLFNKIFLKKKNIIFFYSRKKLVKNSFFYIEDLFKHLNKDISIFYIVDCFFFRKKYFIILQNFFSYIYFADIFISNYLSENVINSNLRIYIHHDIYDTPVVSRNYEKYLVKVLFNYNYIFIPSKSSKKVFLNLINKYKKKSHLVFKIIKYPKIEFFYKKKLNHHKTKKIIIIAPTNIHSFKISLMNNLESLTAYLLKFTDYKIAFRPHPSNIGDLKINTYINKFIDNNRFIYDTSENYQKIYSESKFMITDLSGTAYTYALIFKKPVIFFIPDNFSSILKSDFDLNSDYFLDMKYIGAKVNNFASINKFLKQYLNEDIFIKKINYLKHRLGSPFHSKKSVVNEIHELLNY